MNIDDRPDRHTLELDYERTGGFVPLPNSDSFEPAMRRSIFIGPFGQLKVPMENPPSKEVGPKSEITGGGVFAEAMREVVKTRTEANKSKAIVLINQGIELIGKWNEQEKQFMGAKKKFFKDFGKVYNRIEALSRGETLANVEAKEQEGQKQETQAKDD